MIRIEEKVKFENLIGQCVVSRKIYFLGILVCVRTMEII